MRHNFLIAIVPALALSACGTKEHNELAPLTLKGTELHPSLITPRIEDIQGLHVPREVLKSNPQRSSEPAFVEAISRASAQGRPKGKGVKEALYALYRGDEARGICGVRPASAKNPEPFQVVPSNRDHNQIGFYGLEATSLQDADALEGHIRGIWAHNAGLNLAQVHRKGQVIVVVWTYGVPKECWESVNRVVAEGLGGH